MQVDEPVIIKCSDKAVAAAKMQSRLKEIKSFKKLCFACVERKLLPLKSKFIILEDAGVIKQLGLSANEVYILRNDIL